MANALYPKLALTNLGKNKSTYFPYMLTSIVCIMTYYIMQSIAMNEGLMEVPGAAIAMTIFFLGTGIIAVFCIALMFYTNSFLIKRRKKELGLYCVLGMEKRHVALVFETLFTAIACLALGLVFGVLFSKLLFMALLYLLDFATPLAFSVSVPSLVTTVVLFACIYGATLLYNMVHIRLANPVELLHGGQKGEKEPKTSWLLTFVGLAALAGGYFIAVYFKSPLNALLLFFVAVFLVILGTFCLFTAGSIALLKALRRRRNFYYRPNNFIAVSGMMYRMKQNAVGLANICILACMVLVTVSGTLCLYLGAEKSLDGKYPDDILVTQTLKDDTDPAATLDLVQRTVADAGRQMADLRYETSASFHARYSGNTLLTDMSQSGLLTEITVLTAEEYSRLTGETVALGENQVLAYADGDFQLPETFFYEYEEAPIQVKARLDSFPAGDSAIVTNEVMLGLVADGALAEHLMNTDLARRTFRIHLNTDGADSEKLACAKAVLAVSDGRYGVASRQEMAEEFYAMYGGFLFLGIFLGLLFLMATVLIIYYKQVSEGYEDQRRYQIMQQVGMSRREVGASIRGQILLVFFLPLLTAGLHILAAFPMLCRILELFGLHEVGMFALCTAGTLAVFAAVYALVYGLTARTYERIVGGEA